MADDTLEETETTAWVRLLRASAKLAAAAEQDLKAAGLPALSWHDALLELHRAGSAGLRPGDLQAGMLLPQYNVSRLIDRLAAAGYVERRPHPEDGRGQVLLITGEGIALTRRMWRVYRRTIRREFSTKLADGEARRLARTLGRLL